ncbi:MAG TPA: helix-turn-helix domain-containing protein [Nocardioidaceae bacterium]|nr:helix-turn-helix domain-containing protein [Nocardioidaceae bacterium]
MTPSSASTPDRRRAIVDALAATSEPQTVVDIAEHLGIHGNTVRFHLDALIGDGLVERVNGVAAGPGRPAAAYRAVQRMDPAGPRQYQMLAGVLASLVSELPDNAEAAVRAGRSWGAHAIASTPHDDDADEQAEIRRLVRLLADTGFEPHTDESDAHTIELRHCPFLEIAYDRREVICPIHLGLMQGALDELNASSTVEDLEPFAQPDRCVAHLRQLPA